MIGFCLVRNIKSETLFNSIKDALGRPFSDCKVQCYDGESNMVGAKTGVATRISEIESHANLARCHGHAVTDTIKAIKIMRGTLDAAFELNKLIKYSMVYKS